MHKAARVEVRLNEFAGLGLGQPCVSHTGPPWNGDLDHWRLVTCPDASDTFHRCVRAAQLQAPLQGMKYPISSLRQAARVEADLDLGAAVVIGRGTEGWLRGDRALPARQEVADCAWHLLSRRVTDSLILDPHHRGECADRK